MFSRLGRSISRSPRSIVPRNVLSGGNGGISQILTDSSVNQSRYIGQPDDNLGVLKRYLGSLAANNQRNSSVLSSKVYISDINSVLANPRFRRFFSSEVPKSKKESSKEDDGTSLSIFIPTPVIVTLLLLSLWHFFGHPEEEQIHTIKIVYQEEQVREEENRESEDGKEERGHEI